MKVYEGSILTVDERDTVARYLVEDGGLIAYVGDALPKQYADAAREHLGNRALCPSFVDTHQHFASLATFNAGLNVMEARSNDEIQRLVAEFSRTYAGKVLIAFGASPYSVAEGRLLSRAELDEACPDKPVMMVKYDGHACVVNSALLGLIEGRVSDQRGYHPDTGEMNQEAFFKAHRKYAAGDGLPCRTRHRYGAYRQRCRFSGRFGHLAREMGGSQRSKRVSGACVSPVA